MKKSWVILLALLLPCIALADGYYFDPGTCAVVANPDPAHCLNLREHPWVESESLGKYYNGVIVQLVAEYETSPDWVYVEIGQVGGGAHGFMMRKYLAEPDQVGSTLPTAAASQLTPLLSKPSPDGKVMANLTPGTAYTILGYSGSYQHIQVNGCLGYIHTDGKK